MRHCDAAESAECECFSLNLRFLQQKEEAPKTLSPLSNNLLPLKLDRITVTDDERKQ
jgi:hypothetical protein